MKAIATTFIILFVLGLNSCYYDNEAELYSNCPDTLSTYSAKISPLISNNCFGSTCHNQTNSIRVDLTNFSNVFSNKEEILCRVVEGETCSQGNRMPPSGNLSSCDRESFSRWQQNGYPQ